MFFLNRLLEITGPLAKSSIDSVDKAKNAVKTINEDLYLLLQKSILSGEYYYLEATTKVEELSGIMEGLELAVTTRMSAKEAKGLMTKLTALSDTSNKATEQLNAESFATTEASETTVADNATAGKKETEEESKKATEAVKPPTELEINLNEIVKASRIFRDRYLQKFQGLNKSVFENLRFFSTGQEGIITDTRILKNYKLKNELETFVASDIKLDEFLNSSLFDVNILLSYIDEYLECSEEILTELRSILAFLNPDLRNKLNGEIFDLLSDKARFLEYKILWRNFHQSDLADPEPSLAPGNRYSTLQAKIIQHYKTLNKTDAYKLELEVLSFRDKKADAFLLEKIHHLNRHFRKSNDPKKIRKGKLDSLLKILKSCEGEQSVNLFDQIAFKSFSNLLFNSIVDLECQVEEEKNFSSIVTDFRDFVSGKRSSPDSTFINDHLDNIRQIANSSFFPDYYSFKVFLQFLGRLIVYLQTNPERLLETSDHLDDDKIVEAKKRGFHLIDYIRNVYLQDLRDIKSNLRKMMTHEVKPAYLSFKECFIDYNWSGMSGRGNLFLDSSYILPNDFIKIKNQVLLSENLLESQLAPLKNSFEMALNQIFIQNKNNAFERKVKDNEIKLVQIIAMFISVATFVLINVRVFDGRSGLESFGILLGLAACFFMFNLFFYFLIMAQLKQGKQTWKRIMRVGWFLLVPASLLILSYFLLSSQGQKTNTEIKSIKEKMRMDSIENRRIIDVLQRH